MTELIQQLMDKLQLPEDKAKMAIDAVIGFLKNKLGPAVSGPIDSLLGGGGGLAEKAQDAGEAARDLLGGLGGGSETE